MSITEPTPRSRKVNHLSLDSLVRIKSELEKPVVINFTYGKAAKTGSYKVNHTGSLYYKHICEALVARRRLNGSQAAMQIASFQGLT